MVLVQDLRMERAMGSPSHVHPAYVMRWPLQCRFCMTLLPLSRSTVAGSGPLFPQKKYAWYN